MLIRVRVRMHVLLLEIVLHIAELFSRRRAYAHQMLAWRMYCSFQHWIRIGSLLQDASSTCNSVLA